MSIENRARARRLGWVAAGLAVVCIPVTKLIVSQPHPGTLDIEGEFGSPLSWLGFLAFSVVGALIVSRHPRHLVGWIFCISGLSAGLSAVTAAYAELGQAVPGSLPAAGPVDAMSNLFFLVGFLAPTTLGLLLFPDGRLPSARWRPLIVVAVVSLGLQFAASLLGPGRGTVVDAIGISGSVVSALGAVASLTYRWRHATSEGRQEIKWVAAAGVIVVLDLAFLVGTELFRPSFAVDAFQVFNVAYTTVPIAVGVAILRYRLYDIDFLINRAIVYALLTALLAGVYAAFTALLQKVFLIATGQRSDAAIVISVFVVATIFTPARNALQSFVDKRFKDSRDLERLMKAFEDEARAVIGVLNPRRLANKLLDDAAEGARSAAALYLHESRSDEPTFTAGTWDGAAALSIPLMAGEREVGTLALGPRRGGAGFSARERERLQNAANLVALALSMSAEREQLSV
jgi:hypothetical protein